MNKKVYQSKTIGVNTLAPILSYGLAAAGFTIPAEVQISILAVLNWALRFFTKGPIGKPSKE